MSVTKDSWRVTVAKRKPTKRGGHTLRAIAEHIWANGYPPTHMELRRTLGVTHGAIGYRLQTLVCRGLVDVDPKIPRGLRLTDAGFAALAWNPPLYTERK